MSIDDAYEALRDTPGDISEHLPQLRHLASAAGVVLELGVRAGVSTVALLAGQPRRLVSVDIETPPNILDLAKLATASEVEWEFRREDSRQTEPVTCGLLFVDTLHTEGQLAAELERHAPHCSRWIALHDTVTFGETGEDGGPGLLPAVDAFLFENPDWTRDHHYPNNNGLTLLRRKHASECL